MKSALTWRRTVAVTRRMSVTWPVRLAAMAVGCVAAAAAAGATPASSAAPAGVAPSASAFVARDDNGAWVRLAAPPRRLVVTLPSLTETVCTLGACNRLVGVDRYSNWPASVQALPKVGGGIDPQIETIVALKPDLVLVATSSRAADRLRSLGLTVAALEPKSHEDARRVSAVLAQLLGLPAQAVPAMWQRIDTEVAQAAASVAPAALGARVYFEASRGPYAAGPSSFVGQTLARLQVHNIAPAHLGPFPKLNPEFVARANPDVIMMGARGAQGLEQRPGWSNIAAVRSGRVCRFTPEESDVLVRPGPRMGEAAHLMAACLNAAFSRTEGR